MTKQFGPVQEITHEDMELLQYEAIRGYGTSAQWLAGLYEERREAGLLRVVLPQEESVFNGTRKHPILGSYFMCKCGTRVEISLRENQVRAYGECSCGQRYRLVVHMPEQKDAT